MDDYGDIINLPYEKSVRRKHMSIHDRAAQFAPFAALTGHEEAVKEVARLTEGEIILDEYEIEKINGVLMYIKENIDKFPSVSVTYFVPDKRKEGGEYKTVQDNVKKIKEYEKKIILYSGEEIPLENIVDLSLSKCECEKMSL